MQTRTMHRIICFIVTMLLFASCLNAMESDVPALCYETVSSSKVALSINSSGLATCSVTIRLRDSSYSAEVTMTLQQYKSGSWTDIKTWEESILSLVEETRYVTSGYTYRVSATVNVYSSSGNIIETISGTSPTKSY